MPLNLNLLKRLATDEVIRHIETGQPENDLIIEGSLMKPLERIISFSLLKERGISKIYLLESFLSSKSPTVIYFIPADIMAVQHIINHIKFDQYKSVNRKRWVLFYPGRSIATDYLFESEGVMGDIIIDEIMLNFIPLESDVLSMEYPLAFKQLYINQTHIPLINIARALVSLQSLFGGIPWVYTVGNYSYKLVELWKNTMQDKVPSAEDVAPEIGTLILIDRNVDPITLCSSQTTFEGLLADVFSIKSGFIETEHTKGKFLLTGVDPIFNEIRDSQLTEVVPVIKQNLREIADKQTKTREISSVSDMKQFVSSELKTINKQRHNLTIYLDLSKELIEQKTKNRFNQQLDIEDLLRRCDESDEIIKYIEWFIVSQREMLSCLKLMCLWNCTKHTNINKTKKYFIDIFLQSYGFKHLSTFYNLECSNLYTNYDPSHEITYKSIVADFDLIPNEQGNPDDISSVFNQKYRPISSTIIEKIISQQFPPVDCSKYFSYGIRSYMFSDSPNIITEAKDVIAVFYIGGVCHSEISAVRLLSKKYNKKILLLTTAIVSGSDILNMHIGAL